MAKQTSAQAAKAWGFPDNQGIKLVSKCPICGSRYKADQAKIIEQKAEARLIHIECRRCRASVVAVVVQAGAAVSSVGLVTDLMAEDVYKFKDRQVISEDDCLSAHKILEI